MSILQILRQIRKLDWRDKEIFVYVVTCLSSIWNVKYNNIHCMANLLAGLKSYQVRDRERGGAGKGVGQGKGWGRERGGVGKGEGRIISSHLCIYLLGIAHILVH